MTREEQLCGLARFNIAMRGYQVIGSETGVWLFRRWRVEASRDGLVYQASANSLSLALHRLMVQLPEFGQTLPKPQSMMSKPQDERAAE